MYEIDNEGLSKKLELKSKEETRKTAIIDLEGNLKPVFFKDGEYRSHYRIRDKLVFLICEGIDKYKFIVKSI